MRNNFSVRMEGVHKKFANNLKTTMTYGILDIVKDIFGLKSGSDKLRPHEFWALKDVSFELFRGEILGIIGPNGAGKSTLLKLINGIFLPDKGQIMINGRVGALIELGAGFHPMLTGRENIYVNASILGIPCRDVDKRLDEIIEFSGIRESIDMPVKFYSSGMHARLGFSIAAHMDADILLVDEVLAVGDTEFQEKSMKYMADLIRANKAVVIVSHSLYRIESLCNRAIWLERGKIVSSGSPRDVIRDYLDDQDKKSTKMVNYVLNSPKALVNYPVSIDKVEILDSNHAPILELPFLSTMTIRIHYNAKRRIYCPQFNIRILHKWNELVDASMLADGDCPRYIEGPGIIDCEFDRLPLTPRVYDVLIFVREAEGIVDIAEMNIYARFRITDYGIEYLPYKGRMSVSLLRQNAIMYLPYRWKYSGSDD